MRMLSKTLLLAWVVFLTNAMPGTVRIQAAMPLPWQDQDIGAVVLVGSATYAGGLFTVLGSGDDIWDVADGVHFVFQSLDGDGEILLRVVTQDMSTHAWAKAGVMIRETLNADSAHAMMVVTPGQGTSFQYRMSTGQISVDATPGNGVIAPCWLRIARSGDTLTGYLSADGSTWVEQGIITIPMANPVYLGMVVTAHNNAALSTATFDNVQVVTPQKTAPSIIVQPQSLSMGDGGKATFSVTASGSLPLSYQWQFKGANLAGANGTTLTLDPVLASQAGVYNVVVTNSLGSIVSSNAVLTVISDTTPPTISSVTNPTATNVVVVFSEPVQVASAINSANYALNNGASVQSVAMGVNDQTVVLTTTALAGGMAYTLTINNVRDRSANANPIAANSQASFSVVAQQLRGLYREVYNGASGTLSSLLNLPNYPDRPDSTGYLTNAFESPSNIGDYYGQRVRGYVVPPATGNYTFWISSDDNSALYLSTDDQPAMKVQIASVNSWTGVRVWNVEANQQSSPVALEAGKIYYIEALMAEGSGEDNLAVKWQLPSGVQEEPIPASRCYPWGTAFSAPVIALHPTSVTSVENGVAVFQVGLSSLGPANYQWQKNGVAIPGATSVIYTNAPVPLSDNGARFRCLVSNAIGSTNSHEAVLTVTPDLTRPTVVVAQNFGQTNLNITFSEAVQTPVAGNFTLNNGAAVTAVALGSDARTVVLTTSPLNFGTAYVVTVNGVKDRAVTPNTISPNSQITFTAVDYAPRDIGNPTTGGATVGVSNGYDITGGGSDIGGISDQLQFGYQLRTGDFDVKVRVQSLDLADTWSKAGLMARETTDANSRFAGVLATPSLAGCFFESRNNTGAAAVTAGTFPVNFPNTWLRLTRSGNQFTGYAGFDGLTWTQLGSVSVTMPASIYFGMVVCSHNAGKTSLAQFRDLSNVTGGAMGAISTGQEPLGPSTRKTGLVISEIMYHPAPRADGRVLEFIELFNANPFSEDISGYRLSGDVDFTFPTGTVMAGGGFLVVARLPQDMQAVYGLNGVLGPYTNTLKSSGTVRLRNNRDAIYLEINYDNKPPWPVAADGAGHSLVLARPSYGENDPQAWDISDVVGGSPGNVDAYRPSPLRSVVINEFLAHTDPPLVDTVELYNHSNQAVDLSGCVLTDDPNTNKFVLPSGTSIPARGFLIYDETQMGFALSAAGETLYFKNPSLNRVLDAVRFEAQANGVSMGRYPDGAAGFYPMATRTLGTSNSGIGIHDIVINETMFDPISGNSDDEYVELYNRGANSVDLSRWKFIAGISFTMPTNTVLAANSYLVIAKNATNLFAKYPNLNAGNTVGDFSGTLANSGERLALAMRDEIKSTNTQGVVTSQQIEIVVDEVTYRKGGAWGQWSAGGGSSLELIDPRSNPRLPSNWADSDETAKTAWTTIQATGPMDNGRETAKYLEVMLNDAGECLMDNVEVLDGAGTNLVANSTFEGGWGNWVARGNQVRSTIETISGLGGYNSSQSLHLRASGRGDYGANRVITTLSRVPSGTVTIRAKVRWLCGFPEILMRLHGNFMEATGSLAVPAGCGTPGARNSRWASNAGPAIYEVKPYPILPAAGQPVVVTARVHDPDGIAAFNLLYRPDASSTYTTVAMADNGTGGDAIAGDGIYSGTIPGQTAGILMAFRLSATDKNASPGTSVFPAGASPAGRECLVRFGEPAPSSSFGTYRMWFTQTAINSWVNRPVLSNEPVEGTFVYGDYRVIYNIGARYAGSPYHQGFNTPTGNDCHYSVQLPDDNQMLGTVNFNKIHGPGNGSFDDNTIQREQTAYWMARQLGLPWLYRRYVNVYVNGARRGTLMEDMQTPDPDLLDEHFPNDNQGNLYKLQPWFEMDDVAAGSMNFVNESWCTLNKFTTTVNGVPGQHKMGRYRWNYLTRAANGTANNYTNVYALIDAANNSSTGPDYVAGMQQAADMEMWMRTFAIEHAVGNWDSVGYQNAQNMYGYKPTRDGWKLFIFDLNIVLGNSGSHGPDGGNLWNNTHSGQDTVAMPKIYNTPVFRRAYLRGFKDIAAGPMVNANVDPIMDAKYAAFTANGISVTAPDQVKTWIATMRNSLLTALTAENANVAFAVNGSASFSTNNSLVTLTGTAPVDVKTVTINQEPYPVTWVNTTTWRVVFPVGSGANQLTIQGYDLRGNLVSGATQSVTVTYTGAAENPQDFLAINEIMYNPLAADASFVEIFNSSTKTTFDLSDWRLDGIGYLFPPGTLIAPTNYLVVVKDKLAFAATFGGNIPVLGEFSGALQNDGETLSLVKPGATPAEDVVIDRVKYNDTLPWPEPADGFGPSLQLIDARQDHRRAGNWAAAATNASVRFTPGAANSVQATLAPFPKVWLNEVLPNNVNSIADRLGHRASWLELYNSDTNAVDLSGCYLANNFTNLTQWAFPANAIIPAGAFRVVWADGHPEESVADEWHTSFSLDPATGSVALSRLQNGSPAVMDYLNYRSLSAGRSHGQYPDGQPLDHQTFDYPTPGATNNPASSPVQVFINEWMASNTSTVADPADGHMEDWFELYNAGTNTVDLTGYYLTDNLTNAIQWPIPTGTVIEPQGYLLVWADNDVGQNTPASRDLHANFKLSQNGETICLFAQDGAVVDSVTFGPQTNDVSQGRFPDGTSGIFFMTLPTPRAANVVNSSNQPPWRFVSLTGTNSSSSFYIYLTTPGDVYLDDVILVSGTVAESGANWLKNGDFESPLAASWTVSANHSNSVIVTNLSRSGKGSLQVIASTGGTTQASAIWQDMAPSLTNGNYTLSYWYLSGSNAVSLITRLSGSGISLTHSISPATNRPPVLAAILDQTINEGSLLSFNASATDGDMPPQTLTYTLDPVAPAGAIMTSAGVFSWTPTEAQGPSTNTITVRVTDNGSPALSDSRTFTVIVQANALRIASVGMANGVIALSWNAALGSTYKVQYKERLSDTAWTDLGEYVGSGDGVLSVRYQIDSVQNRFYRIQQIR